MVVYEATNSSRKFERLIPTDWHCCRAAFYHPNLLVQARLDNIPTTNNQQINGMIKL